MMDDMWALDLKTHMVGGGRGWAVQRSAVQCTAQCSQCSQCAAVQPTGAWCDAMHSMQCSAAHPAACAAADHGSQRQVTQALVRAFLPHAVHLADPLPLPPPFACLQWDKVKKAGMAPGPRASFSLVAHKARAFLFGGVSDNEAKGGEDLSSEFHNDLYTFNMDNRRWGGDNVLCRPAASAAVWSAVGSCAAPGSLWMTVVHVCACIQWAVAGVWQCGSTCWLWPSSDAC